jgi:AhpD family alkylhydroperoxidase
MHSRIDNPATSNPEVLKHLIALSRATQIDGLPATVRGLVHLRASQINGCSVCIDLHWRELREAGSADEKIFAVSAWREAPWFSEKERAALELTEAVTRLSDRSDPVPDEVWEHAAKHYDEPALSALVLSIAVINTWNRLNVSTRQIAGTAWN